MSSSRHVGVRVTLVPILSIRHHPIVLQTSAYICLAMSEQFVRQWMITNNFRFFISIKFGASGNALIH